MLAAPLLTSAPCRGGRSTCGMCAARCMGKTLSIPVTVCVFAVAWTGGWGRVCSCTYHGPPVQYRTSRPGMRLKTERGTLTPPLGGDASQPLLSAPPQPTNCCVIPDGAPQPLCQPPVTALAITFEIHLQLPAPSNAPLPSPQVLCTADISVKYVQQVSSVYNCCLRNHSTCISTDPFPVPMLSWTAPGPQPREATATTTCLWVVWVVRFLPAGARITHQAFFNAVYLWPAAGLHRTPAGLLHSSVACLRLVVPLYAPAQGMVTPPTVEVPDCCMRYLSILEECSGCMGGG